MESERIDPRFWDFSHFFGSPLERLFSDKRRGVLSNSKATGMAAAGYSPPSLSCDSERVEYIADFAAWRSGERPAEGRKLLAAARIIRKTAGYRFAERCKLSLEWGSSTYGIAKIRHRTGRLKFWKGDRTL